MMSTLLGGKTPKVSDPATIPDPEDILSKRRSATRAAQQQQIGTTTAQRTTSTGGVLGGEYSRGTLG